MFYVTKKHNLISDVELEKLQAINGKWLAMNVKMMGAFGRRKRYYALRLQRLRRDREHILAGNRSAWEPVSAQQKQSG